MHAIALPLQRSSDSRGYGAGSDPGTSGRPLLGLALAEAPPNFYAAFAHWLSSTIGLLSEPHRYIFHWEINNELA